MTEVPALPLDGEKLLIVGATLETVKFEPLVAVPAVVVTVILPVVAPEGTAAVTLPSFTKLKLADVPLNLTPFTPVKWFPLIVTEVPTPPLDGEKLLIVGAVALLTVKLDALVAVPAGVVTVILPVVAPEGTVPVTLPSFEKLKVADVPLNLTAFTPVKWLPLIVTEVPALPLDGEKLLIVGTLLLPVTVKFEALVAVPADVLTVTFPVVAPEGTVVITNASEMKLKVADVPLNLTLLTPEKPLPLIVTGAPGEPLDGEKLVIEGFPETTKLLTLLPTPSDVVTLILPVVAPIGTVAVRCWSSLTLNVVPMLLKVTADAPAIPPVNPVPVTITSDPGCPLGGLNALIVGVAAYAGTTATVNTIVNAANETTAPRTNARTRIVTITFLPTRREAGADHHRAGRPDSARAQRSR